MSISSAFLWIAGNALLALIPVGAARLLARAIGACRRNPGRGVTARVLWWGLVWLLFLPNTCYLITEWRHFLDIVAGDPQFRTIYHDWRYPIGPATRLFWLAAGFFLYSAFGIVTMCFAVRPVVDVVPFSAQRGAKAAIFLLIAFGVYLGLVCRLNTYDIVHGWAWMTIARAIVFVLVHIGVLAQVVVFAGILRLVYETLLPGLDRAVWVIQDRVRRKDE